MKAIIFDFDGVIVNSYETNYQSQKKRFPGITREDHKIFFEGNVHQIREERIRNGELQEDKTVDLHSIMRDYFLNKQEMKTDIIHTLEQLNKQYQLYIVTSFVEEYVNEFLDKHHITYLFTDVMGIETDKKKDKKFMMLFEKYNHTVDECIFVTDTLGDIKEANKVGMQTIALDSGFHEKYRLQKGNPYKIISKFTELSDLLRT